MGRQSKWTIETATIEAKKYNFKSHFRKQSSGAFKFLDKQKDESLECAISHMEIPFLWTIESATIEAKKYNTKSEFDKKSNGAYKWILKNCSKEEKENIFTHMEIKREKWSIERVSILAKKYNTLKEFREEQYAAYHWGKIHLNSQEKEKIYSHMERKIRGRTFNDIKTLVLKYKNINEFIINENKAYNWAKTNLTIEQKETLGFHIINNIGKKSWSYNKIKNITKKYNTFNEFRKENSNAYRWALRNLSKEKNKELYSCLIITEYMTKEKAIKLSKKYKQRSEFFIKSNTAYIYLRKNCSKEELDIIYSHMIKEYKITIEEVKETIKGYKTKREFEFNHRGKYSWMHMNLNKQEIEELCSHMIPGNRGFQPTKPGTLYYLRIDRPSFPRTYKTGITNYSVKRRFGSDMKYITIIKEERFQDGSIAAQKELEILRAHKKNKYLGKPILQSGNSELFVCDVLGLDKK